MNRNNICWSVELQFQATDLWQNEMFLSRFQTISTTDIMLEGLFTLVPSSSPRVEPLSQTLQLICTFLQIHGNSAAPREGRRR